MSALQDCPFVSDTAQDKNRVEAMTEEDRKLRLFFLEEARVLCPMSQADCTEYSKLHLLNKRLKRLDRMLTLMYAHDWGELLPDLQRAFSFYLLEGYVNKKERVRIIDLLAQEIAFATKMAQFNDFIINLMNNNSSQIADLERLINLYYRPDTMIAFPERKKNEDR